MLYIIMKSKNGGHILPIQYAFRDQAIWWAGNQKLLGGSLAIIPYGVASGIASQKWRPLRKLMGING